MFAINRPSELSNCIIYSFIKGPIIYILLFENFFKTMFVMGGFKGKRIGKQG